MRLDYGADGYTPVDSQQSRVQSTELGANQYTLQWIRVRPRYILVIQQETRVYCRCLGVDQGMLKWTRGRQEYTQVDSRPRHIHKGKGQARVHSNGLGPSWTTLQ